MYSPSIGITSFSEKSLHCAWDIDGRAIRQAIIAANILCMGFMAEFFIIG
jgi:hypothetical protein